MNEDFVTFELAKKLKEKGFSDECLAYYYTNGELIYNSDKYRGGIYRDCLVSYNSLPKNPVGREQIDAPTISQVLTWFREKKMIVVQTHVETIVKWDCQVLTIDPYGCCSKFSGHDYFSYEEAALAGIEYVLDNLI